MNTRNHDTHATLGPDYHISSKKGKVYILNTYEIYISFYWIRCFFGPMICHLLFSVGVCNIFCDFNEGNTVKSGNIYTPRLCFSGEMQRYTTFIEFYTCLDNDFSTLIENGNNFQFSQAVCAKSSVKLTCLKLREISYPFFVCKTVAWVDIGKFTVNKAYVKRLCILIKKMRL